MTVLYPHMMYREIMFMLIEPKLRGRLQMKMINNFESDQIINHSIL